MKYKRSEFNQQRYLGWQIGRHVPEPIFPIVYHVIYDLDGNNSGTFSRIRVNASSPLDALERVCYNVTYGTRYRPEDVDLQSVHDEEDNLLWVDEPYYNIIQKKYDFKGMERREFLKRFGLSSAAILYGLRPEIAHGIIPFGFIRSNTSPLQISINGGINLNITSSWLNSNYGWNTTKGPSVVITNTGNITSNSTNTAALTINVSMPAGRTLKLINNSGSYIVGRGGDAGASGGLALQVYTSLTIVNSGVIGGGVGGAGGAYGGGGAGGGNGGPASGGGAGGGGAGGGMGGSGGPYGLAGGNATSISAGGAGGASSGPGTSNPGGAAGCGGGGGAGNNNTGGPGGAGGAIGVAGGAGSSSGSGTGNAGGGGGGGYGAAGGGGGTYAGNGGSGSAGGSAGAALSGKSNVNSGGGIASGAYGTQS